MSAPDDPKPATSPHLSRVIAALDLTLADLEAEVRADLFEIWRNGPNQSHARLIAIRRQVGRNEYGRMAVRAWKAWREAREQERR